MKTKKYAAFAIAMVMAVSCLGAFFASDGSEAEITLKEGDTWGMGAYIDEELIVEQLLKALKESNPEMNVLLKDVSNKAELIKFIKDMVKDETSFEKLDFSVYFGQHMLFEVASEDADGYVINFAVSMLVKASVNIKCREANPSPGNAAGSMDINDTFVLGIIMLGTVSTDADLWVKKISVTTDVFAALKGKNNYNSGGVAAGGADDPFEGLMGSIDIGVSLGYDSITEFKDGHTFQIFPGKNTERTFEGILATSNIYNHVFVSDDFLLDFIASENGGPGFGDLGDFGDLDGDFDDFDDFTDDFEIPGFGGGFFSIDDDFFEDFEVNLSMASFLKREYTAAGNHTITVECSDDEIEFDFGGIGIMTPFGGSDLEIEFDMGDDDDDDDDDEVSTKEFLGSRLIYEEGFKLTGDNVDKVKDGVSKAIRAYEDNFYDREVEVSGNFADTPLKKRYGEPIGTYENDDEDKKFVGWNVAAADGMHLISEDFVLKSNVKAEPVFVKETALDDLDVDKVNDLEGLVYVKITGDETTAISKEVLTAIKNSGGVLIIDGPGYKWVLTGDELEEDSLNPVVNKVDWEVENRFADQSVVQLSFRAEGTMPDGTKVTYDASGEFATGSMIDVYVMDDGGNMEFIGSYRVGASGCVEFDVPHCSEYLLVQNSMPTQAYSGDAKGDFPVLLVAVAACVVVAALAIVFYIRK
ncbi:MAG: hypothetical protein GX224_05170 [Thermoplasmatales archaeon]|nr:hypothetical protein [Thermoplasmatales archaeon]